MTDGATARTGRVLTASAAIQAPAQRPAVHLHDQPLLKPLSTLGKPKVSDTAVSFLRRTEYISSVGAKQGASLGNPLRASTGGGALRRPEKRKSPEPDAGTPAYVRRKIERSFDVAQAALKDRSRVRHPTKSGARLAAAYPVLPDLDSFPDSGAYVTIKFTHNPVPSSSTYDRRLLSGIFVPVEKTAEEQEAYEAALAAYELDPARHPRPTNAMNYNYFLPSTAAAAAGFRAKFDVDNPDRDDDALYTARDPETGAGVFSFDRVRGYETAEERELGHDTKYSEEIVLGFADDVPDVARSAGRRAAFYYPVMQRSTIRSQRTKNIARTAGLARDDDDPEPVRLDVTVVDPTPDMVEHLARVKEDPLYFNEEEDEEAVAGEDDDDEARLAEQLNGSPAPNRRAREADSDEQDAEGDDEE